MIVELSLLDDLFFPVKAVNDKQQVDDNLFKVVD